MNNLDRRIERMEEKLRAKCEPRVIVLTINPDDLPEGPYAVKLSPGVLCAYMARGGPFTDEEIRELRDEERELK